MNYVLHRLEVAPDEVVQRDRLVAVRGIEQTRLMRAPQSANLGHALLGFEPVEVRLDRLHVRRVDAEQIPQAAHGIRMPELRHGGN